MKVKRYFGSDTRQTMRQIRREQGPDAVILSCRATNGGTEIVTALESRAPVAPAVEPAVPAQPQASAESLHSRTEIEAIRKELKSMQGMLDDRFSKLTHLDFKRRNPVQADCQERLEQCGISASLAQKLTGNLSEITPDKSWHDVQVRLAERIITTNDDILTRGGAVAMVGPAGMGKTAVLAKLATRYLLTHGRDQVAILTTDHGKVGAISQLQRIAQLLKVPFSPVKGSRQLREALGDFSSKGLVLVDTQGIGLRGPAAVNQFKAFARLTELKKYLVSSSLIDRQVFEQALTSFGLMGLSGVILTHVEESIQLGPLVSTLIERRTPVAYLANGPRIPEDISPARPAKLAAAALMPNTAIKIKNEQERRSA